MIKSAAVQDFGCRVIFMKGHDVAAFGQNPKRHQRKVDELESPPFALRGRRHKEDVSRMEVQVHISPGVKILEHRAELSNEIEETLVRQGSCYGQIGLA